MKSSLHHELENRQNQYGLRLAAHLSTGSSALPYDISERLRATREQALAQRKVALRLQPQTAAAPMVVDTSPAASLAWGEGRLGWWNRVAVALLLLLLLAGLTGINKVQSEQRAREVAEVDAAILTDPLPPAAYADPGFVHYLKQGLEQTE